MPVNKLLLISYDAVGDGLFETLFQYPNFQRLAKKAAIVRGAKTVFLSNTYPVHASVATGLPPGRHGLVNNTDPFPAKHPKWRSEASKIRAKTLWQAAHERGLTTAAVLWPVTAGAKEIRWNIPEVMAMPGRNQILTSLRAGSKWLQLKEYLRHGHLMEGIRQPQLDLFSAHCMADILREHSPDLALMHFTSYDSLCHENGLGGEAVNAAFDTLDFSLGLLLDAAGPDTTVLLFSDHSQLPAGEHMLPNELLADMGLLHKNTAGEYVRGDCFVECCGGSAFLHPGRMTDGQLDTFRRKIVEQDGFSRFLTSEELAQCGRSELPLGFAAKPGYSYMPYPGYEKANHGYPLDADHYKVFYLAVGPSFQVKSVEGGSLLELAPLIASELDLNMPDIGHPRTDLYGKE